MVNFGLNSASILGIFLAVAGASLYFMRSVRPELSRDHDIFFAAVGLVCGAILLWSGWRLDPILQLSQYLLTGSAIFFAFEAIRLRGIATEQARRSTPIVDDDRPVSKVYRKAELDERELYEEDRYNRRQLQGSRDSRSSRRSDYEVESRRSRSRSRSDRPSTEDRSRSRRTRTSTATAERYPGREAESSRRYEDGEEQSRGYEASPYASSRPRRSRPDRDASEPSPRKRRRSRPSDDYDAAARTDVEATPVDYVDYQPIDEADEFDRFDSPSPRDYPAEATSRDRDERRPDSYGEPYEDDYGTPYEEEEERYESDYEGDRAIPDEETDLEEDRNPQRYDDRDRDPEWRSSSNFDY